MKIEINIIGNICNCDKIYYKIFFNIKSHQNLLGTFYETVFEVECSNCGNKFSTPLKNISINFSND
jgi:hypothetical protein